MSSDLITQAVSAALNSNWPEAIKANLAVLEQDPKDVEALNRLARAYKEAGRLKLAQRTYRKVLTLDRFNPIAQKNLKLLESLPKHPKKRTSSSNHCPPQMFLEEPGKTKIVNLVNLAPNSILLTLCSGDQTNLFIKRRSVIVVDGGGTYLGALPDDLSLKLIKRILAGNRYEAYIKTVGKNCLSVLIRETFRAARFRDQPTFPPVGTKSHLSGKGESLAAEEETEAKQETPADEELPLG